MKEVEVKGGKYLIGKIDAMRQFHVSRRISPLFATAGVGFDDAKSDPMGWFERITRQLAVIPDSDVEYIINTCLSAVSWKQSDAIAVPVISRGGGLMNEALEMDGMLELVAHVLMENLGGFFSKLPAKLTEAGI